MSMSRKLYVGNLPFKVTEEQVKNSFSVYGGVESVKLIMDRETGRPRGFGFVTMADEEAAGAAIAGMNGKEFDGRKLVVNEAREKPVR